MWPSSDHIMTSVLHMLDVQRFKIFSSQVDYDYLWCADQKQSTEDKEKGGGRGGGGATHTEWSKDVWGGEGHPSMLWAPRGRYQEMYPPDEVPIRVSTPPKAHRAVAVKKLLEKWTAGQPHPAACVHAPVCVQQQLLKDLQGATHSSTPTYFGARQERAREWCHSCGLIVSNSFRWNYCISS